MAALVEPRSGSTAQERFLDARTLIVTGEGAQESRARADCAIFEPHRTDTRADTRRRRQVDHWRPIHGLDEAAVWTIMRRHGILSAPAPAPAPGSAGHGSRASPASSGGRTSGPTCAIAPAWFECIAAYEDRFGCTIQRHRGIRDLADRGQPYHALMEPPHLARRALSHGWTEPARVAPHDRQLSAGAFGNSASPT